MTKKQIKKYINARLKNIEKAYDPSSWNYTDVFRMESEEAYQRGIFEALKIIKNLLNEKKL